MRHIKYYLITTKVYNWKRKRCILNKKKAWQNLCDKIFKKIRTAHWYTYASQLVAVPMQMKVPAYNCHNYTPPTRLSIMLYEFVCVSMYFCAAKCLISLVKRHTIEKLKSKLQKGWINWSESYRKQKMEMLTRLCAIKF